MQADDGEVTRLLHAWTKGDQHAFETLFPLIYRELHNLAVWQMKSERSGHTLSPTGLLHESFVKLVRSGSRTEFQDRKHFYLVASNAMRQLLIDYARQRSSAKRSQPDGLNPIAQGSAVAPRPWDVIDLDRALHKLETDQPRRAKMIELRYFGGLTVREIGDALDVSAATVTREIAVTEAWLAREIKSEPAG